MAESWNDRIIKEFRANNGKVGGMFEGAPMLLVTTAGRRTGKPHTNPVIYLEKDGRYLVFASNLGADDHPDWYRNILASPQVTMEIGTDEGRVRKFATRAVVLEGEERDRLYAEQCAISPAFGEYQDKTERVIPVVALTALDLSKDSERNKMIGRQLIAHHNDLRAALGSVRAELDAALDGGSSGGGRAASAADLGAQLRAHCLRFCYDLQMHHTREDGSFTAFEEQFPELRPAIARLREEHKAVERALGDFERLIAQALVGGEDRQGGGGGVSGGDSGSGAATLRAELDRTVAGLEEHFAYEEEQLLPAVNVARTS
jgi:deazaflavin-dependent oxidoreductase (nitroreductase family)